MNDVVYVDKDEGDSHKLDNECSIWQVFGEGSSSGNGQELSNGNVQSHGAFLGLRYVKLVLPHPL